MQHTPTTVPYLTYPTLDGKSRCALPKDDVLAVLPIDKAVINKGILYYEGAEIPMLDVRERVGQSQMTRTEERHIVIARGRDQSMVALVIDGKEEVLPVPTAAAQELGRRVRVSSLGLDLNILNVGALAQEAREMAH